MGCMHSKLSKGDVEKQSPLLALRRRSPQSRDSSRDSSRNRLNETKTKPERGPLGVKVLYPEPDNCDVDIVFLHGLTGGSYSTWRAYGEQEPWPRTLLPQDLPRARVITCGYDVDCLRINRNVSGNSILDHTQTLLADLDSLRHGEHNAGQRPLIFVAHSLGGLLVQDILHCSSETPERAHILESTKAIFFMGTPHEGSSWAPLALACSKILILQFNAQNRKPLEVLIPQSDVLTRITNSFAQILRRDRIRVICFYEELAFHGLKEPIVNRQAAQLPGRAEPIGLHADHSSMTKFASRDDDNYVRFMRQLKGVVNVITRSTSDFFNAIRNDNVVYVRENAAAFDLDNDTNSEGMSAVCSAAYYGSLEVFKVLTCDFRAKQDNGDTTWNQRPLFRAAMGVTPAHLEIVKLLVANPHIENDAGEKDGQTALAVAASRGNVEVVKILLDAGADPTHLDKCSPARTALSRARATLKAAKTAPTLEDSARILRLQEVITLLEERKSQYPTPECLEGPGYIAEPARKRDTAQPAFEGITV